MPAARSVLIFALSILAMESCAQSHHHGSTVTILNASYDPTRELYSSINKPFAAFWHQKTGQTVEIEQSHTGSGKQARAVIEGLQADVVTLALAYDIDAIVQQAQLIHPNWASRLPNHSVPYTSTIVFLVRKGNPKGIHDWPDIIRPGVSVITPNPKTSGGARWNYLAAWGYAWNHYGHDENKARNFVAALYHNAPVLDSGARGSTTTFVQRNLGDVLLAWENEAYLSVREFGANKFEIIYPSSSIIAETPVAIVDQDVDDHGTRAVSEAYLQFLYTEPAQEIAAKNYYRPLSQTAFAKYQNQFPPIQLFTLAEIACTWQDAQKKHFADHGVFDQIYKP